MTDRTADPDDSAGTDRARLAGSAYSSDRDLAARQSLYQWQTPRHDLPGIVVEQLGGVRGRGRVVDVGCGNGKYVQRLREDRPDLSTLGLDISPGILATVPGPVAVADVTRLPLATGSVDAALAMHMLYHVPDIPQAVRELARVVARDGVVIASTNNDRDKVELDDLWHLAVRDVLGTGQEPPGSRSVAVSPWRRPRPSSGRSSAGCGRSNCPAPSRSATPSRSSRTWRPTGPGRTSTTRPSTRRSSGPAPSSPTGSPARGCSRSAAGRGFSSAGVERADLARAGEGGREKGRSAFDRPFEEGLHQAFFVSQKILSIWAM